MKRILTAILLAAAFAAGATEVSVTNVVCAQRYPWNGMVDIDYEVVCDDPDADVWVYATGMDNDMNVSMAPRALTGDGVDGPVKAGKHRMTWNVTADYPGFASTAFTVKMCALVGGAPYMVVDLSGGVDALSYPVSYLNSVPAGGWTDEYKTTKMVFRLIPPGTFRMGSPSDEVGHNWSSSREPLHEVSLTKPFYLAIFECTQKQYQLVMGTLPFSITGNAVPVWKVTYNSIRGTVNGAAWPAHNQVDANSFMGRLRSKANMMFDLPTEAQWEYACRAGTETALNNGKNLTGTESCPNLDQVAQYNYWGGSRNGHENPISVGLYRSNSWGLYDMHGNVAEWCLDWWCDNPAQKVDPKGPSSGQYRVVRGGSCCNYGANQSYAASCRSAYRGYIFGYYNDYRTTPDQAGTVTFGFRVACLPAD